MNLTFSDAAKLNSDKAILGFLISGILVVYTTIVFAFFGSEGETRFIFLFLMGAPLVLAFFVSPKTGIVVVALLVYSVDWISETWSFIPREATWMIDMLLMMFIGRVIITNPWRKTKTSNIEKWILVAILFSFVSALINGTDKATFLVGLRLAFKYMLLYIAVSHLELSRKWMHTFFRLLFAITLIQPAVVFLQWRFTNWVSPDDLFGTLGHGNTGIIAFIMLILLGYTIARVIEERHLKGNIFFLLAWLSIAPILGEAKTFFLVFPVLVAFMIRAEFTKRPVVAISMTIIGVVSMLSFDYAIRQSGYWVEGRNPLTYITQLGEVYQKEISTENTDVPARFNQLVSSTRLAAASLRDFLAGNGPGSISYSLVAEGHSRKRDYFNQWNLNSNAPSFAWLLIEYGYLGTILILIPAFLIYRRGRVLRNSEDQQVRIYGRWLEGIVLLYILWLFYIPTIQIDSSSYPFWTISAILVRLSYKEEEERKLKETLARAEEARKTLSIPEKKPIVAS